MIPTLIEYALTAFGVLIALICFAGAALAPLLPSDPTGTTIPTEDEA